MYKFYSENRIARTISVSLFAAIGAILFLTILSWINAQGDFSKVVESLNWFWIFYIGKATLSAMISGGLCWWHVVEKPKQFTHKRYVTAGALCGISAHPFFWFLCTLFWLWDGEDLSEWGGPMGMIFVVPLISAIVLGWLTAGIGALGGALLSFVVNRFSSMEFFEPKESIT